MKLTDKWAQLLFGVVLLVVALAPLAGAMWFDNPELMLLYVFYGVVIFLIKLITEY